MTRTTTVPIYREFEGAKVRVSVGIWPDGCASFAIQGALASSLRTSAITTTSDLAGIRDAISDVLAAASQLGEAA